ncbi:cytochrome P450 [Athelia psychrophila]|uniref:Cytochrome P450 n=1 Tax=Athelia psychrophila TaxID=1759441 RepID=A0A166T3G7_9AGAM|nr:cytochrome P450 [Fibularhizoctonia sp. CBS 109695]
MSNVTNHHSVAGSSLLALPVLLAAASGFLVIFYTHRIYKSSSVDDTEIYALGGLPLTNTWAFFNKRYDFLRSNFERGHEMFSFKVMQHKIVAMSGENGRQFFFHDKNLNFREGYRLLMGSVSDLNGILGGTFLLESVSQYGQYQVIPTLFSDVHKRMETWGSEGQLNPFNNIQTLVFQMTVRMASCSELSTNYSDLDRMSELYWELERNSTPASLLLPWFPGKARRNKKEATRGLYNLIDHYVQLRRSAEVPSSDTFDFLIADGAEDKDIVAFVQEMIFAGAINTGMLSCWTMIYLGAYPEWKAQAIAEIQKFINTHTNTTSSEPLHQRLSAVPISAWEDEMPVLERIIRETMRIALNETFLRRNVVDDIELSGKNIPRGAFILYSSADAHLNPEYYPDPLKFDPGRFDSESCQGSAPFLAWGTGRHPCSGMKVAKFEVKMILVLMLTRYDYSLVDASGAPATTLPEPDRNNIHQVGWVVFFRQCSSNYWTMQARPTSECFIRYQQIME